jgi:hypothetical protein
MKLTLALTAAALLPTLAAANPVEDAVLTSFERDMQREPSTQISQASVGEHDPLIDIFYAALYGPRKSEAPATIAQQSDQGDEHAIR